MRLNLGCGRDVRPGWTNVDVQDFGQEIVAPLDKLPLDDAVAVEIHAIHVIEHVDVWEAPVLIAEWHRVLAPGGVLRVEFPDFGKVLRQIRAWDSIGPRERRYLYGALYGDYPRCDPYMTHRWCHAAHDMAALLAQAGFARVVIAEPAFHRPERDAAVLGVKAELTAG